MAVTSGSLTCCVSNQAQDCNAKILNYEHKYTFSGDFFRYRDTFMGDFG